MLLVGETQQAEALCKEAIRQDPDNPDLRKLYGDVYLATNNGRIAEVAFKKAISLGANADALLPRLARALLLQQEYLRVLSLGDPQAILDTADQLELAVIRLRAELALPGGNAANLRRTTAALVTALASARETEHGIAPLQAELEALREDHPLVDAAYEHARCQQLPVQGYLDQTRTDTETPKPDILRVGPTRAIKTPAQAAKAAVDGSVVEIDVGEYPGGVALWPQNDLTIKGVGGRPHIQAAGRGIQARDIWLFTGDQVVVENMEFSGARAKRSRNGAGIRHTGNDLVIRHSYFHDNDNGVLTWKSQTGQVTIEFSEFARNGFGDGLSHNVYIGETASLIFRYNYSHAAKEGHLLKTRARINDIRYNRLTGEEGEVSYVVDIPNGGVAYVVGNVIEKAVVSKNPYVITFGQEGLPLEHNKLFVSNNSIYNRYDKTILVRNAAQTPAAITNNLIGGIAAGLVTGPSEADGNRLLSDHGMVNPAEYDFALHATAGAIDAGIALDPEVMPSPVAEYVHPVSMRPRAKVAQLDVGAQEFCGAAGSM